MSHVSFEDARAGSSCSVSSSSRTVIVNKCLYRIGAEYRWTEEHRKETWGSTSEEFLIVFF